MGNCLSSFRAQFRPNRPPSSAETVVPLTPTDQPAIKPSESAGELPKPPSHSPATENAEEEAVLVVQTVDLMLQENCTAHHTIKYEAVKKTPAKLVIRRGFPFRLKVDLNRKYSQEKDAICLVFVTKDAKSPSYAQGTMVLAPVVPAEAVLPSDAWQAKLYSINNNVITVEVTPVVDAIIGEWILDIDTKLKKCREEDGSTLRYPVKQTICLLFNPWCKQDSVYMNDAEWRKEYVMGESGLIWRGSHSRLRPSVWNFGQFEEDVLECSLYLLSKVGKLNVTSRADPVKVVRHISAVVNSPNEGGVLVGNWFGVYNGGTAPTAWAGSQAILQKFYKTKKPVRFGQCWVFSGVCTTVCRAIGIPARCITNFSSAHDTHCSLTVDLFYDAEGEPVSKLNTDSVWNFHVWNEVWMERPDLEPGGYGGWQAIDATPQEESDGAYRCGPASIAAIKRGEINKPYDTTFLFAEVNADKVFWRYRGPSQPLKLISKASEVIGQFMSTKALSSFDREDITQEYKYSERTKEEREVMLRALRQCGSAFSRYYLNDEMEDVQFDFILLDDIVVGSPFTVKLKVKNKNIEKEYNLNVMLRVDTTLYTGELKHLVKKQKSEVKLSPGAEEELIMNVVYSDYEKALVDQGAFNIASMATVLETGFDYFAQDDFRVRMPDIIIETEGELIQGSEFSVNVYFKNPLPKALTKAMFTLEGPGLGQPLKIKIKSPIHPEEEARAACRMTPRTGGEKTIAAKFQSRELDDVDGYKVIQVKETSFSLNAENSKPSEG